MNPPSGRPSGSGSAWRMRNAYPDPGGTVKTTETNQVPQKS